MYVLWETIKAGSVKYTSIVFIVHIKERNLLEIGLENVLFMSLCKFYYPHFFMLNNNYPVWEKMQLDYWRLDYFYMHIFMILFVKDD